MTDRLRKLDAMFAEKVLRKTGPWCEGNCEALYCPIRCQVCDGLPLSRYTRSLDAAWEGMSRMPLAVSEIRSLIEDTSDGSRPYHATVGNAFVCAAHPAEALVLACLKAVGVDTEAAGEGKDT